MTLQDLYGFLNFCINKSLGYYYSPEELDVLVHRGSLALYADYQPRYATSQRIKDAMMPFKDSYSFGFDDSLNGIVAIPDNRNCLNILEAYIAYDISGRQLNRQVPIVMVNEDVRAIKLNSQIDPVTVTTPIGEEIGINKIQIYPQVQYRGAVSFLRMPKAPHFVYTVVSGRLIVYDPIASVQLEWRETQVNEVIVKCLSYIGIAIGDKELMEWSEAKGNENFILKNHS